MRKSWLLFSLALFTGCSVFPAGSIFNPGNTKLEPKVLAVTETGETTIATVQLSWNDVLNAQSFEVVKRNPENQTKVFTTSEKKIEDKDVALGKTYAYTVRALDGNNMQLTVSSALEVTPLENGLEKPVLPAATLTVDSSQPDLTWNAVPGASWYYVSVLDRVDNNPIYGAFANTNTWKLGTASYDKTLNLSGFPQLQNIALKRGSSYGWNVTAIKANGDKLESANAIAIRKSDPGIIVY